MDASSSLNNLIGKKTQSNQLTKEHTAVFQVIHGNQQPSEQAQELSPANAINRYLSNQDIEIRKFLKSFCDRYTLKDTYALLDRMAGLRVMIVGDTIIDEYQFCQSIGKSSKDPTLALKFENSDSFAGGALAIANHVAQIAGQVELFTVLGEFDSKKDFILEHLHPDVHPHFFVQDGAPTIIKRRFVDSYNLNKLLEVYIMDDSGLSPAKNRLLNNALKKSINDFDVVIAADFGHGAISSNTVDLLSKHAPFLAVNTQANAGNRGFHTISKYKKANYISIAEHELRLEMRDLKSTVKQMMGKLHRRINSQLITITQGRNGCTVSDKDGCSVDIPALAKTIIDRIGSGDALLALTALAAALKAEKDMIGFLGNVAGALAVEIMGNKKAIDKNSIKKFIQSLYPPPERYDDKTLLMDHGGVSNEA